MAFLPAYDNNNGWDPTSTEGGAEPGTKPKSLYYLNDALGSAIGLMEQDGHEHVRYHYDEFGVPTNDTKFDVNWPGPDNLFGYTGLGYDKFSGLIYARARYYQPELGRFISEDTYKGDIWNTQSQNLFTYVRNNPLKWIDPSGYNAADAGNNDGDWRNTNNTGIPTPGPSVSSMIDAVRIAGANSNTYWKYRSDLGSTRKVLAWSSMSRNQFLYLFGLATQTVCDTNDNCRNATEQEKSDYFTAGNAEWAKQQLIHYLDVGEVSNDIIERTISAMGPTGKIKAATSLIKNSSALVNYAQQMGRNSAVQKEADSLIAKYLEGNTNPGLGTKNLFADIFYLRGRDGARVFYKINNGTMEILAKADKSVEQKVIDVLKSMYGN